MPFSISRNFYAPLNLGKAIWLLKISAFFKNLVVCSSAGPKILVFGSHCSANFQPILDCFIPNFKLKYEDLENIKADRVSTVVFNLLKIKRGRLFWDSRYDLEVILRELH